MKQITKKQIGKIQVRLGFILLILTGIGTYFVINQFYEFLSIGSQKVSTSWSEAQTVPIDLKIYGEAMSSLVIISFIYQTARYLL